MPKQTALLVIDVQVGMFNEGDAVYDGDAFLDRLVKVIVQAHQHQVPVIYIQHDGGAGHHLQPGSPNWHIHPRIAPQAGDTVIRKQHPDAFQGTALEAVLGQLQVSHLVVGGIQTEYCVDTTCRRAYSLGYPVTLLQDMHTTWDQPDLTARQIIAHHNTVLGNWFVTPVESDALDWDALP